MTKNNDINEEEHDLPNDVFGDDGFSLIETEELQDSPPSGDLENALPDNRQILQEISLIREIIENNITKDKGREKAFEVLYQELDEHKRNKNFEDNRPLFMDLILFYDRLQMLINDEFKGNPVLASLLEELREILCRKDVEVIESSPDSFDPGFQKALRADPVESPGLDGKIVQVIRDGFVSKNIIIRPQEVVVGRYQNLVTDLDSDQESQNQSKE